MLSNQVVAKLRSWLHSCTLQALKCEEAEEISRWTAKRCDIGTFLPGLDPPADWSLYGLYSLYRVLSTLVETL